jgi:hypothetical protein
MSKNQKSSFNAWFRRSAPWVIILFVLIAMSIFTVALWFFGPKLMTQKYDLHFYFAKGMNKYAEKEVFIKASEFLVTDERFYFPSVNSDVNYSEADSVPNKFPATGIPSYKEVSKYTVNWGYFKTDRNIISDWFGEVYSRNIKYDTLSAKFINAIVVGKSPSSVFLFYSNKQGDPDEYYCGQKKFKVHKTINSLIEARNKAVKTSGGKSIYIFCNPPESEINEIVITDTLLPIIDEQPETPYHYFEKPVWVQNTTPGTTTSKTSVANTTTAAGNYSLKVDLTEESSFVAWSGFPDNADYSYEISLQYTDGNGTTLELLPPTECNDCKEKYAEALKNKRIVINDFIEKRIQNIGIIFYLTVYANNNSGVVASKKYRFNVKHGRITCIYTLK